MPREAHPLPDDEMLPTKSLGVARVVHGGILTRAGLTLGTVSYMSPEQIESADVDGRADIWSLGVVLYEMLAGHRPFERPTSREVLAAIAGAEPPALSRIRDDIPQALQAIVDKALRKDADERYPNATVSRADLEELDEQLRTRERIAGALAAGSGPKAPIRGLIWAWAAVAALLAVGVLARIGDDGGEAGRASINPVPFTSFEGAEDQAAISPDGTRIAFVWDGGLKDGRADLYVQLIGSYTPLRLTNSAGVEFSPTWSPDGKSIAFLRQLDDRFRGPGRSTLLIIPALGGPETALAEIRTNDRRREVDWSPLGEYLAVSDNGEIIFLSPQSGARVAAPFSTPVGESHVPRFDPSGKRLALQRMPLDGRPEVHVVSADGGESQVFFAAARDFAWNHAGTALVLSHRWYGPLETLRLQDGSIEPSAISDGLSPDVRGPLMAFTRHTLRDNIWALDLAAGPAGGRREGAVRLISSSRTQDTPRFSPDGTSIVFASNRSGSEEIWACGRDGGNPRKLTSFNGAHVGTPRWSPDARTVAFDVAFEDVAPDIYTVSATGGDAVQVTRDSSTDYLPSWSRDGRWIYFSSNRGGKHDIWKIRPEGGEAVAVTHNARGWEAFESADGNYLYYSIGEYSKPERGTTIFRLNLRNGATAAFPEVGDAGARRYWAVAEKGIYFVDTHSEPGWIQFLEFESRKISKVLSIGNLVFGPGGLAISPDGRTLLYVQRDVDEQDIMLVENFE